MGGKVMKKELSVAEANIELNDRLEDGEFPSSIDPRQEATSTNMELQKTFYAKGKSENIPPTYINNNTAAIKISGDEE